jgi:endonuclease YncB( thermonuclease family)
MITPAKPRNRWLTVLLIIVAVILWIYGQTHPTPAPHRDQHSSKSTAPRKKGDPTVTQTSKDPEKTGGYEIYRNCTLVEARNNDGDSFMLRLPNGRQAEFRLYFVDTPESAFKSYRGGETNRQRIAEQAAEMGGITPEQAVEIGQKAKHFTLELLARHPFTIYTEWDSPFHDDRFHAHVEVMSEGKSRWLDELLVELGFVRIHTKPAPMPDGTAATAHKNHLKDLERAAKKAARGVWGL